MEPLGKGEKAGNLKQVSLSTNMRSSYIFFILIPKWILIPLALLAVIHTIICLSSFANEKVGFFSNLPPSNSL